MTPQVILKKIIKRFGPIPTIRVSSAQAKGAAKRFAYWGPARYQIVLTREGKLSNLPLERARSARRAKWLAKDDADKIAEAEGRFHLQTIGQLSDADIETILSAL